MVTLVSPGSAFNVRRRASISRRTGQRRMPRSQAGEYTTSASRELLRGRSVKKYSIPETSVVKKPNVCWRGDLVMVAAPRTVLYLRCSGDVVFYFEFDSEGGCCLEWVPQPSADRVLIAGDLLHSTSFVLSRAAATIGIPSIRIIRCPLLITTRKPNYPSAMRPPSVLS